MGTDIYYRNEKGVEIKANLGDIPQKCGDCGYCTSTSKYSHYDDLDGFDVSYRTIVCGANQMTINTFREEGSFGYDYGYRERTLAEKPDDCPLYQK